MKCGIQHRSIYLAPPDEEDLAWFFDAFDTEEIWLMFGFVGPSKQMIQKRHADGDLLVGIIHKVVTEERIGFVMEFAPVPPLNLWEYAIAIPDPKHRDLRSAIEASDAWGHYFFDHLQMEVGGWRQREDNGASISFVSRMGFRPFTSWDVEGVKYQFFRMDRARWQERLARLQAEEDQVPSDQELFITLEPPYQPVK